MDLAVTKCGELKVKAMKHCQIRIGKNIAALLMGLVLNFTPIIFVRHNVC